MLSLFTLTQEGQLICEHIPIFFFFTKMLLKLGIDLHKYLLVRCWNYDPITC